MTTIPPILLVGLGKMGGAMLAGWREKGVSSVVAVDPACPPAPGPEVTVVADAGGIPADFRPAAVVLAVKPQNADETLAGLAPGELGRTAKPGVQDEAHETAISVEWSMR